MVRRVPFPAGLAARRAEFDVARGQLSDQERQNLRIAALRNNRYLLHEMALRTPQARWRGTNCRVWASAAEDSSAECATQRGTTPLGTRGTAGKEEDSEDPVQYPDRGAGRECAGPHERVSQASSQAGDGSPLA